MKFSSIFSNPNIQKFFGKVKEIAKPLLNQAFIRGQDILIDKFLGPNRVEGEAFFGATQPFRYPDDLDPRKRITYSPSKKEIPRPHRQSWNDPYEYEQPKGIPLYGNYFRKMGKGTNSGEDFPLYGETRHEQMLVKKGREPSYAIEKVATARRPKIPKMIESEKKKPKKKKSKKEKKLKKEKKPKKEMKLSKAKKQKKLHKKTKK